MSKTLKALGKKEMVIDDRTFECTIKLGDSRNYIKEMSKLKKQGLEENTVDLVFDFFMTLVTRGQELSEDDVTELQFFADSHLTDLAKEVPILLGIAKREDLEKAEELKN